MVGVRFFIRGILVCLLCMAGITQATAAFVVGVGISDITGEAAQVGMMGYGEPTQQTSGIHQRLRARAFIIEDPSTHKTAVLVVADLGLITQAMHQAVLAKLAAKYGQAYNAQNVLLTATHTHSGPGGYSHYTLYNITIFGFKKATFDAAVDGMVEAIDRAHQSKAPGDIFISQGDLTQASRNRSLSAFQRNPSADRAFFPQQIDPLMTLLTFQQGAHPVGALSLFPTHGTSMTNANPLISGDNKGYAAYYWEHEHAGGRYRQSKPMFVSAFAQTNAGDMSPNLLLRPGHGPTDDEFENTKIIGERQVQKALSLFAQPRAALGEGVDYRMRYVDMSAVRVASRYTPDGQDHQTCPSAMGAAFAAGSTEDGPGPGIATEGQPNPVLAQVGRWVFNISESLRRCHGPKEIVIPTGTIGATPWVPQVLPIQLIRLGRLYLAALPGEPTIMSGYRIRKQLASTLHTDVSHVLVVGYSNAYASYITTPEEYSLQEYEGGSTLFGPWTQPAYQQELDRLAQDLIAGRPTLSQVQPAQLDCCQRDWQPGVWMDSPSLGHEFGNVLRDAKARYRVGDTVMVSFQSGHPRNDLHRGSTFLEVQQSTPKGWVAVADDGDWSTRYRWVRRFAALSRADISWAIPPNTPAGTYRIVHFGDAKALFGGVTPFTGTSSSFQVLAKP